MNFGLKPCTGGLVMRLINFRKYKSVLGNNLTRNCFNESELLDFIFYRSGKQKVKLEQ